MRISSPASSDLRRSLEGRHSGFLEGRLTGSLEGRLPRSLEGRLTSWNGRRTALGSGSAPPASSSSVSSANSVKVRLITEGRGLGSGSALRPSHWVSRMGTAVISTPDSDLHDSFAAGPGSACDRSECGPMANHGFAPVFGWYVGGAVTSMGLCTPALVASLSASATRPG